MSAGLRERLRFYAITPDTWEAPGEYGARVTEAIAAGATCVQFRDKRSRPASLRESCARAALDACRAGGALFVVNDDVTLALTLGADGVHLGPDDAPIATARALAGPSLLIGGSAGSVERAEGLVGAGADYLGVGAIFDARASKANASAPRGVDVLRAIRDAFPTLPFVAIGGVDASNARACLAAGADGVAVIRAAWGPSASALALALR